MQFKTLIFASLATLAFGQSVTTPSGTKPTTTSTCAAQNILDACLGTTKIQVNACAGNDWDCLCNAYGVVATCYNNCPADPSAYSAQQQRDQYCAAAANYGTKASTKSVASATSATSAAASTHAASATSSSASASATAKTNAAAGLQVGSGMIAVALAGLGMLA